MLLIIDVAISIYQISSCIFIIYKQQAASEYMLNENNLYNLKFYMYHIYSNSSHGYY